MRRRTRLAIAGGAALAWGEWLNWRWSRALTGSGGGDSEAEADAESEAETEAEAQSDAETEAVVVLGFQNPQATANFINRWRVRAGIRSIAADPARDTRLIFSGGATSGGATSGGATEARLMADYAQGVLAFDGSVLLEDKSATTWENITNVIPLLEDVDRIKIVSQPAHALKARLYLRRQRPDLAERLVSADDYRLGEWLVAKPLLALYGLWKLRGLQGDRTVEGR
ncbi:MAG: YdcF family protein [Streptomyces sp.]